VTMSCVLACVSELSGCAGEVPTGVDPGSMDEFCPWTLPMNLECEFVHRLRSYDAVEIIIMLILPDPTRTHLSPSYASGRQRAPAVPLAKQ
jgi:hypothetical protein